MRDHLELKSRMLVVLAAALTIPIASGFVVGGPGVGLLAGAVVAVILVVVAVGLEPRDWMLPMSRRPRRPRRSDEMR